MAEGAREGCVVGSDGTGATVGGAVGVAGGVVGVTLGTV
eukprot:gene23926-31717_t